ncbi:hypothetical protein NFI96_006085 [Prochilodus magdalenae]|nr:hypothetical protein NFI96_006085 [Prochilodus magdalenae]
MSCMEEPLIFLRQLRDHNLKVIKMKCKERRKDGVYQILDWLERERRNSVHVFWSCVFRDHILRQYPVLRLLRNSLMDGSFRAYENLPEPVDQIERENTPAKVKEPAATEKKRKTKRKKSADKMEEEEEPGPSRLSTTRKKRHAQKPMFWSRSKSIRTEERWFTLEEFVKQEVTLTDGHWKKDIRCHGKTVSYLLKKKILAVHSLLCSCNLCSTRDQDKLNQNNDDECFICNSDWGDLLCCDECPRAFHHLCHIPAMQNDALGEKWACTFCVLKANQRWLQPRHMSEKEVLDSSISQYTLYCEYLLLRMYREDVERVFTEDPTKTVSGYSRRISRPMWLGRVKTKLQKKEYKKLGQFVSDVRLIFKNCHIFNKYITNKYIKTYRPLVRRSKPVLKQVRTWPSGAISALQDCFEHTDWQMFSEAATYSTTTDLEEYTSSVTSYISKCIDDVTVSKTITTRPYQKPWMTAEVRALLKARD